MEDVRNKLPRNGTYMRRPLSAITQFSIHWDAMYRPHDYDSVTRYVGEAQMHINKDWGGGARGDGLMYHIKIDNVGTVFQCRDFEDVLWNVGGNANYWTLAVCFDCGADQQPTREQIEAFQALMVELCTQHPEFPAEQNNVYGHRDFNPTQCPGDRIEQAVNEFRTTGNTTSGDLQYDWPPVVAEPAPVTPVVPIEQTPAPVVLPIPDPPHPTPAVDPIVVQPTPPTPETPKLDWFSALVAFIKDLIKNWRK